MTQKIAIKPEGEPAFTATIDPETRAITFNKPSSIDAERSTVAALRKDQREKHRQQAGIERRVEEFRHRHGRAPDADEVVTPRYNGVRDRLLGPKEDRDTFSLSRMIRQIGTHRGIDGLERELADEGRAECERSGIRANGLMIPRSAFEVEARGLTATGGTGLNQGGMTIETEKTNLLDSLFDEAAVVRAGATVYRGLIGNFDVPRLIADNDPAHKAENATADEVSPTTAQVSFTPKRLSTVIEVSNQLLQQSSDRALMDTVMRHLRAHLVQVMERAMINGTGSNTPTGILKTSGIGAVVGGAAGAAPTLAHVLELVQKVATANALTGSTAFLINSATSAKLKQTQKLASTDSRTLIDDTAPGMLSGYRYLETNAVPSNLTKGSASGLSALIFGNFSDSVLAQWSGIEFLVNPYSKDDEGLTRINASIYYDFNVVRPESFAAMQDAITA